MCPSEHKESVPGTKCGTEFKQNVRGCAERNWNESKEASQGSTLSQQQN